MYEELVKQLREAPNDWYDADLHYEAADAIERLSSLVDHYGGETGIKNLEEYAIKYWEIVKKEKANEQYNKAYAYEYCNAHPFL